LTATLAERLRVEELVNESVWLGYRKPGAALPGRKVMSLVHGMLAGADSIDRMNVLRAGPTGLVLGHQVMAPSTLGTFLRAFTFGHVRQLDYVLDQALARAWESGARPGELPLVVDIDSFIGEVHSDQKQGASYGYTRQLGYHPIVAVRVDVDHRDHAQIELVIRDLKDQALAHFPSGQFNANSAWTVIAALAHNLGRWVTQIGQPNQTVQTARSRRRHLLQIPGRLTRTGRQWTLRMPARWP
jgi:hypothetical protein